MGNYKVDINVNIRRFANILEEKLELFSVKKKKKRRLYDIRPSILKWRSVPFHFKKKSTNLAELQYQVNKYLYNNNIFAC